MVFKLSRFGRNAADVLASLQVMQDFGVNLICVEDGIDSSKDAGKLMISVLSAVAEIERENIRIQTMEGRMQKAREGKWNGGFAPYGYKLVGGKLEINEKEAEAIRVIFMDGIHEAIISEDVWEQARIKVAVQAKKYEKVNSVKGEKIYLLSGLLKCPICGAGMYGNKSIKSRKDGTWQFFFFVVRPVVGRT